MAESTGATVVARKAKKPRLTFKQEIQTIQNLPRLQRLIVALKVGGVLLVAIGLEGIVSGNYLWPIIFIPLGVFVSMLPIKVRIDRCLACAAPLGPHQAICPICGAPQA
ncbi:MAG: hypothetical protein E6K17_07500 [Methanobacteriota archaeon]|nr:MAG: hypothetical protein E6K17_07500 [Euryarchaeota archaeon]